MAARQTMFGLGVPLWGELPAIELSYQLSHPGSIWRVFVVFMSCCYVCIVWFLCMFMLVASLQLLSASAFYVFHYRQLLLLIDVISVGHLVCVPFYLAHGHMQQMIHSKPAHDLMISRFFGHQPIRFDSDRDCFGFAPFLEVIGSVRFDSRVLGSLRTMGRSCARHCSCTHTT